MALSAWKLSNKLGQTGTHGQDNQWLVVCQSF